MTLSNNGLYQFGDFRLDVSEKLLTSGDRRISLTPKVFEMLLFFLENSGKLITKEELLDNIWAGSFVEESNLTFTIRQLRKVLDDDAREPKFIETVARRGYRFIAGVEIISPNSNGTALIKTLEQTGNLAPIEPRRNYRKVFFLSLAVLFLAGIGLIAYKYLKQKPLVDSFFTKTKTEKIPVNGILLGAIISSDGKYLAYVGDDPTKRGIIMLRQLETGIEREVINIPESYFEPRQFSSDGNYIFVEYTGKDDSYSHTKRIAVLNGEMEDVPSNVASEVGFSRDGKKTVFYRWINNDQAQEIVVADIETKSEKVVYTTHGNFIVGPEFSADGSKIAFFYADGKNEVYRKANLGYINVNGGEITQIGTSEWNTQYILWRNVVYYAYRWFSDDSGFLIAHAIDGEDSFQIFKVSFPDGQVSRITEDNADYNMLTLTSDNKTMATVKKIFVSSIWEYDLQTKQTKQLTQSSNSKAGEMGIFCTDDNKILFTQLDGKGNANLLQMDADGKKVKTLVSGKGKISNPIVSPDGKFIFFTTNITNPSKNFPVNDIWRVNIDGSNLTQLNVPPDGLQALMGVAPDNRNLLKLDRINDTEYTKARMYNLDTQKTLPIANDDSLVMFRIDLSPNGKQILYATYPKVRDGTSSFTTTFKLADFDGENLRDTPVKLPRFWSPMFLWAARFAPDGKSIYYLNFTNPNEIWNVDTITGKSTNIIDFPLRKLHNFAVSRDGKKLYVVLGTTTDEVTLIKDAE